MRILSIETSCDETGASVVEKNADEQYVRVLSNVTATSIALHAKTGGIIPENAAREQVKFMIPTIVEALLKSERRFNNLTIQQFNNLVRNKNSTVINQEALEQANIILKNSIDAIAVTYGPGLIGSLLVGVETAKTLSFAFEKPLIPIHHLLAHLSANFIRENHKSEIINHKSIEFPFIGLIVSGGHTDLLLFESISKFKWLGGTRDDAAGEALDKIGRLLNLSYPAGPEIELRASRIKKSNIKFQSPLINSEDFDFSFSGLKTEVSRFIQTSKKQRFQPKADGPLAQINEVCYALQDAIFAVLIKKTIRAAKLYNVLQIVLGGGVSANSTLRELFEFKIQNSKFKINVVAPEKIYATDNAAMIGSHALLNYNPVGWHKITAQPDLYFD